MHGELIAFDIEATGLDIKTNEIIEIGIVKFQNGEIKDQYSSLVKPSIPIPADITHLTGIHPEDVQNAPPLADILPDLESFFGQTPVIAHNSSFDVTFMQKYGLLHNNYAIDTYELSAIMLPAAPRYNLHSLTTGLGITLENAHRALDDSIATAYLYWELWKKVIQLPPTLIEEIINSAKGMNWQLLEVFQKALNESQQNNSQTQTLPTVPFSESQENIQPLDTSKSTHNLINESQIDKILGEDGVLSTVIPNYEHRDQQIEMSHIITDGLNKGKRIIIEAGTGTGKSLAYLLPSALWASENSQRVVVSTQTINLQDQLLKHDIPLVKQIIKKDFRAAVMKGRGNYLCPRRLETMRRRKPTTLDELRTLSKILVWMQSSKSGDKSEITLRAGEWAIWSRLSAQDEGCTTHRCSTIMKGVCPYYKARKNAESAHIVIANHSLLIADAQMENRVLPEYYNLVIDEAHQLEDAITNGLSIRIDQHMLLNRLNELGSINSGILGEFLASAHQHMPDKASMKLEAFIQNISEALNLMKANIKNYFQTLHDFVRNLDKDIRYQLRLLNSHRDSGRFVNVQMAWKQLGEYFDVVSGAINQLSEGLARYKEYEMPNFNDYESGIRAHQQFLKETYEQIDQFTQNPDANSVYSISPGETPERLRLHIAPLHVGPMMEKYLTEEKESIILTSATLRTQANFDHIKERLYADDYQTVALGSPFNYKESTLLYIPDDIPEPNRPGYQKMVERGIIELAAALGGRVMVLFTSYAQLRETSKAITPRLILGNIAVYDQSFGTSRESLLASFKGTDKAVVMGTRSFWQGIDIPGDDLSALVIVRLPFAVPSDPIFASRSEAYNNPFKQYAIPDTILRFRQGFGRLIRSKSDRGVVAIFDSRIITKSYGNSFLESLPDCTTQYGSLENLPKIATGWIDKT
jgi:ATP-dependent DNA helicase DinG